MLRSDPDPAGRLCIAHVEFNDAYAAVAIANCEGYIVDAALDVTWSLHDLTSETAVGQAHHALLKAGAAWLSGHGPPPFFIYSIERVDTYGLHSHITLDLLPAYQAAFRAFLDPETMRLVAGPVSEAAGTRTSPL